MGERECSGDEPSRVDPVRGRELRVEEERLEEPRGGDETDEVAPR